MDRAWYGNDEGYDETNNPFADMSEEYTKMKEEQLVKKSVKRISAQQRQFNQVSVQKEMYVLYVHVCGCACMYVHACVSVFLCMCV